MLIAITSRQHEKDDWVMGYACTSTNILQAVNRNGIVINHGIFEGHYSLFAIKRNKDERQL